MTCYLNLDKTPGIVLKYANTYSSVSQPFDFMVQMFFGPIVFSLRLRFFDFACLK